MMACPRCGADVWSVVKDGRICVHCGHAEHEPETIGPTREETMGGKGPSQARHDGVKICDECDKPVKARGKCATHYSKARRNGTLQRVRGGGRRRRDPSAAESRPSAPKDVDAWIRQLIRAADDGVRTVLEVDGRTFMLTEVEITEKK